MWPICVQRAKLGARFRVSDTMAMPVDGMTEESMKREIEMHNGTASEPLHLNPMSASEAAAKIKEFTETWPDPFKPGYQYSSPWATKKDNKGKKERPAGSIRPGLSKGGVQC